MNKQESVTMARLIGAGFSYDDANKIRLIEKTLHRWAEAECNGEIERNEQTQKPVRVIEWESGRKTYPTADRETGAIKRLEKILTQYPEWTYYHQTDPRGAALYMIRKADVVQPLESNYSRGIAI